MRNPLAQFIHGSKLRDRFVLFFILLGVVPPLVLGGVALYLIDLSHRQDVSKLELQLIDQKIEEMGKFFTDTLGILELRVGFTQTAEIELSQQIFLLDSLLEENKAFEEVSFINLSGIETAKKSRWEAAPALFDVSRLPEFIKASKKVKAIGDVYYSLSGPMLSLAAPVVNRNNEIIQVLAAEVNLSQIIRSIEKSFLGTNGYLVLLDARGNLIAHRGHEKIPSGRDLSRISRVRMVLGGAAYDALGKQDRYTSFFGSVPVIGAGKKVIGVGWALLAEWPITDADVIIQEVRNQVLLLSIFSIVAVLILAHLFAGRLIAPIKKLEESAAEIARGNLDKQVIIRTKDELEDLGGAFNSMAKGLKRLKELQEEFLFIAAHDLKAPVTVIQGYISMILEGGAGELGDKMRGYITQINTANARLLLLVEDLLSVARSESGKIFVDVRPIDIASPITDLIEVLKPLADKKSISISYDESVAGRVMGNAERIKEVMTNLISNAIKYSPEKGKIIVSHQVKGDRLVTNVKDNGFGIPKDYHNQVFEKFFRAKPKQAEDVEGTGLGLFIVKQLVEKMDGRVWFESEEGKGSTFSFSLPLE